MYNTTRYERSTKHGDDEFWEGQHDQGRELSTQTLLGRNACARVFV